MVSSSTSQEYSASRLGRFRSSRLIWPVLSLAALVLLWEVAALVAAYAGKARTFPGPSEVTATMVREFRSGALQMHVLATLGRVAVSFPIAMFLGSAIGIALGRMKGVDRFFDSWLIFFLNLPALVVIILCYVWLGLTETAAIMAVAINKIPNVAVTVREGARSLSRDLAEMAEVYNFGFWKTLRHVTLPQLAPFLIAAARGGLAIVWKIVLVVELLGRSNGVGYQLGIGFQLFDVAMILAYAIAFIIVVQLIEIGILQPLETRLNRWRR